MLRNALPLTSDVSITLNNETLESTRIEVDATNTWVLGRNLDIDSVTIEDEDGVLDDGSAAIQAFDHDQYPYIEIEGIEGRISGQIKLYRSRISGGKSEELGASNGFFINVLGRVINLDNPDFGLDNLNHSAWAQFRATVRADGLDNDLRVERDGLLDSAQLRIFKRFLLASFNKARNALKDARMNEWPNAGRILDGSWKAIPMRPLAEIVSERLASGTGLPGSIDVEDASDLDDVGRRWNETVETDPGDLIAGVKEEAFVEQLPFLRYRLSTRELLVNETHPYFAGRKSTIEERRVMLDFALAGLSHRTPSDR